MEWWSALTHEQQFGAVVAISSAFVGGLLALLGSLLATWLTNTRERKTRQQIAKTKSAKRAIVTTQKLLEMSNLAANIDKQISDSYKFTAESELDDGEPWARVPAALGYLGSVPEFEFDELNFLFSKENHEIATRVLDLRRKIFNINLLMDSYSELKRSFDAWILSMPITQVSSDGSVLSSRLDEDERKLHDVKTAQLNNILGSIVEQLEEDLPACDKLLREFSAAAKLEFGLEYPPFEFEAAS